MMDQLGIKSLRPGPSGDEKALNHANYYESLANSYPQLPDALTTNDGRKVMSAKMWWDVRRPEIVEWMEREVYGRIPANVPQVTWAVVASEREMVYGMPVNAKQPRLPADRRQHRATWLRSRPVRFIDCLVRKTWASGTIGWVRRCPGEHGAACRAARMAAA